MAKTVVTDVIIPEVFEGYVIERTAELATFGQSGIIDFDPEFDALVQVAGKGGQTVKMPFWKDISGARQVLSDSASLTVNKIQSSQDVAVINNDGNAWSVNTLAKWLSGDDPMGAIAELLGEYWARTDEATIISLLKGVFLSLAGEGTPVNTLSIASESLVGQSASTRLNGTTFIDACQKLGDRKDRLSAIAIHSETEAALLKLDLIDFVPDSEGKAQIRTFQGKRVIVDDTLPRRNGTTDATSYVYTSYLFGPGALGKGSANLSGEPLEGGFGTEGIEFSRVTLASDTVMVNRRRFIMHGRGVKWTGLTLAGQSPTDAELEATNNWTRVYEAKNVRCVQLLHNN
jgi:hypothetical protein